MRRRIWRKMGVWAVGWILIWVWTCSDERPTEPSVSAPRLQLQFAQTDKLDEVERVSLTVELEGKEAVTVPVTLKGEVEQGSVWVPLGWTVFTVECRDKDGEVVYHGSARDSLWVDRDEPVVVALQGTNRPPVAEAGVDQTAEVGAEVRLDGSASRDPDGDPLTYRWSQKSGPSVALIGADAVHAVFTPAEAGMYAFRLVVNDGQAEGDPDEVRVSVANRPPVADAGVDQTAEAGTEVRLDGSGSQDPDGDPLTYRWSQESGPTIELFGAETVHAVFTPAEAGMYAFRLVVNDGRADSHPDSVRVSVEVANQPPVADAGADQTVRVGDRVVLDGSGSRDPEGDGLTYRWTQESGPMATLSGDTTFQPEFTPAEAGMYTFRLVVGDGQAESDPDEVRVIVQSATSPREPGETMTVTLPGGATMEMVWIPPGTFIMGMTDEQKQVLTDKGWWIDSPITRMERPPHEVTISRGFWLGKYELTQGQWTSVMGTRPWSEVRAWLSQEKFDLPSHPNYPAVGISWRDVQAFIARLNEAEGEAVYWLPTEAEWEYACRAGTTTLWSFGDDESQLGEYAWYRVYTEGYVHVGTKRPNPWGLYDMHGNVSEWCQDWFGPYSPDAQTDPSGPVLGDFRVVRSRARRDSPPTMRSTFRSYGSDGSRLSETGARLLRVGP